MPSQYGPRYGPRYNEQLISDLSKWNSDKLYSVERIDEYYERLKAAIIKYNCRRVYYYNFYVETCKCAGVKSDKFVLEHITRSHHDKSNNERTADRANNIIKFIQEKQTIADIIEENNRISRSMK